DRFVTLVKTERRCRSIDDGEHAVEPGLGERTGEADLTGRVSGEVADVAEQRTEGCERNPLRDDATLDRTCFTESEAHGVVDSEIERHRQCDVEHARGIEHGLR